MLAWDRRTGRPLGAAVSWQDRRAASVCADLADHAAQLTAITGLPLDPYFAAPKMTWLRQHGTSDGVVTTSDSWLLHRLTGAYVTDVTTASRTTAARPAEPAPGPRTPARSSASVCRSCPRSSAAQRGSGTPTRSARPCPVTGLSVDQQAALIGEHCLEAGDSKCTYGTGAFLLANAGAQPFTSSAGLAVSVAWQVGDLAAYCIDGQVYAAGAAIAWLVRWGFLARPEELDAVASSVPDAGGVTVVPALTGLGAPWWEPDALGAVEGIGPATQPAHVVRATVEGLAAQVAVLARAAAADLGRPLTRLRVDGGLTNSRLLMQTQADLLGVPLEVASSPHATAAGVGRAGPPRRRSRPDARGRGRTDGVADVLRADDARRRGGRAPGPLRARRRVARRRGARHGTVSDCPSYDVAIIGAGVVGTAIGRQLARYRLRTVILERAVDVGTGTSKANTAIVHTGFDTEPGSLESSLVRRGHQLAQRLRARRGHRARGDGRRPGGLGRRARGTAGRRAVQGAGQRLRARHAARARRAPAARTTPRRRGHRRRRHPGRVDHLPLEHEHRVRHRGGAGRCRAATRHHRHRRHPRPRRRAAGWCRPTRAQSGPTGSSTRPGSSPIGSTAGSVTTSSPSRRDGASSSSSTSWPGRSSRRSCCRCPRSGPRASWWHRPSTATCCWVPTAEDIDDPEDTATTGPGLEGLMEAGRRIVPDLVGEEVTATYAGVRAATEHRDYQITVARRAALRRASGGSGRPG